MNRMTPKTLSGAARSAALLLVLTAGVALATSGEAWAKKHHSANALVGGPDPITVEDCGNTTNTPTGFGQSGVLYQLDPAGTFTTSTGDCIDLGGSNDGLLLNGVTITGTGTSTTSGVGVNIGGSQDLVEGADATIQGYSVGYQNSGSQNAADDLNVIGDGIGMRLGGSQNVYVGLVVCDSTTTGIFISSANNTSVSNFISGAPAAGCAANGADGVLVVSSHTSSLSIFGASGNGGDGVHLGGTAPSTANQQVKVFDASNKTDETEGILNNTGDGVFLDTSESAAQDQVTTVNTSGNDVGLHDATTTCGENLWYNNTSSGNTTNKQAGSSTTPACIN